MKPSNSHRSNSAAGTAPGEVCVDAHRPALGLWDTVSIIVGIVVGVTIFRSPPLIFANVGGPWAGIATWLLGGLLSVVGACCYAELATTYPQSGGDYVYLTRAFGRFWGFLFGWAQLAAILTGSIGALAYVFADYAVAFFELQVSGTVWFAVAAVVCLTVTNCLGLVLGKLTQNILTVAKLLGLAAIVVVGFSWGAAEDAFVVQRPLDGPGFGLAMVLVLYAYGGWNDAAFVAAEVHQPRRNIPRALLLGIGIITSCYVVVNLAYLWALGFEGLRDASAPAADVLRLALGAWGAKAMSLLVMVSALGAVNGMILTGSRVLARLGGDHRLFGLFGRWNARRGAPIWALVAQAFVALLLIGVVGTQVGRNTVDAALDWAGRSGLPWHKYDGGFGTLVAATAPVFWFFFLMTGLSVFVLRKRDRRIDRPFAVPFYPIVPILFCGMCAYMLYASIMYAWQLALLGVLPVALGVPLFLLSRWGGSRTKGKTPSSNL
ncbi:MAG: amino acid permease [Planctomycetota bacterium]|nr:amino acid permease [Planctomycetota bacterium]